MADMRGLRRHERLMGYYLLIRDKVSFGYTPPAMSPPPNFAQATLFRHNAAYTYVIILSDLENSEY